MTVLVGTIQERKDTAANWTSANPVLLDGEYGLETDTKKRKLGDGITAWNLLAYYSDPLAEAVANKSTNIVTDQASNTKFPSVKAVFDWAIGLFVQKNANITAATKTKITYDVKGLVTAGVDATTADINDSTDRRYVSDAQLATLATVNTVGTIITESGSSLANWTQTGTAFTTSGGKFNITNSVGSISFGSYLRQTAYGTSNIEKSTITANVTIGTVSSTSFGVGFTYYSRRTTFPKSLTVGLLMDSTNGGKIAFYFNNATTGAVTSAGKMTIASGDVTNVIIKQVKDTYIVTWNNVTQNQSISATYTYFLNNITLNPTVVTNRSNTFNYSLTALGGGNHLVDTYVVTNDENVQPDFLFYGDSIINGSGVGTIARRAIDTVASAAQLTVQCIANGGNWVEDYNINEILAINPKKIVISIGIDNLQGGDSAATVMTKYGTLITALQGNGYVLGTSLFITTLRPYVSEANVPTLNALIRSTYTSSYIELYYPLWSGTGVSMNSAFAATNNLHLNEAGAFLEASIYMNYFNLRTKSSINYNNRQVYADQQGRVAIGNSNVARYNLDVLRELRVGSVASDNGLFIHGLGPSNGELYSGLYYNGSVYVYKDTSYAGYSNYAGDTYWWGATGLTVGNTTGAAAAVARLNSTGRMFIGGSTSPTAVIHLKAGTAAASTAPLKFTSGTNLTTPENGTVEYDGTNYFVTSGGVRHTLAKTLTATATLDFGSTAANSSTDLTITVTGAADGDSVIVTPPNGSVVANSIYTAWVSAANTVTVRFSNLDITNAADPASGTFRAVVFKY